MIKTGFCVSYDWEFLKKSLPRVYKDSDLICLAIDKNRKTWKGASYEVDEQAFKTFIEEIDIDNKIDLYEDDFALPELNSRENCNRHRMLIADRMGKGGWHLQVDSDEYFLNFSDFVSFLKKINENPTGDEKGVNVLANWVSLIKKTTNGYLMVDFGDDLPEAFPCATNRPNYERARHNGYFNHLSPSYVLHETWSRSDEALLFKINNWGHSVEELDEKQKRLSYYELWKSLDEHNYEYIRDFHPAQSEVWPKLLHVKGDDIKELFGNLPKFKFPISNSKLNWYNTKVHAKLRQMGIIKRYSN